ncbi:MAG: hypothetical protein DI535_01380 [Citrobacter freundii]|nr:MAG: hypothetical protein DI535_01380 [Citrobacter freundii]
MKRGLFVLAVLFSRYLSAQGFTLKAGDILPPLNVTTLLNAPVKSMNLLTEGEHKFYIINFWGSWCAPCIPEMEELSKLQKKNSDQLQVIAISDEPVTRLKNYLKKRPTTVWLGSDTTSFLYQLFNLSSVGYSALIDRERKIIAVVKTSSIDQQMLDALYHGKEIKSTAIVNEPPAQVNGDVFGVDTTMSFSFSVRGYMNGHEQGGRIYGGKSFFAGRRISYMNTGMTTLYKSAYGITSQKQVIYEANEKAINNYQDKSVKYCIDLLVPPDQSDSLYSIFQQRLNSVLPVKARIEYKEMPVYVMTSKSFSLKQSDAAFTYSFSGRGFNGSGVTLDHFANAYLSNELDLPVVNETGLQGKFDINTNMDMRTMENVIRSVEELGLSLKKETRKIKILVLF